MPGLVPMPVAEAVRREAVQVGVVDGREASERRTQFHDRNARLERDGGDARLVHELEHTEALDHPDEKARTLERSGPELFEKGIVQD